MSAAIGKPQAYPHPHVNEVWLAKLREDIVDPALPIVDAHHHLWERNGRYLLEIAVDPGHRLYQTRTDNDRIRRALVLGGVRGARTVSVGLWHGRRLASAACAGIVGYCASGWAKRSTACWRRTSKPAAAASRASARAPGGTPR
jgi:hypothetical protein